MTFVSLSIPRPYYLVCFLGDAYWNCSGKWMHVFLWVNGLAP